ncbi:MAG: DUF6298 domain-containing protein [Caldilineaceae bacterium]
MGKHFDTDSNLHTGFSQLWRRPRTWLLIGIVGICLLGTGYLFRHQLRQQAQYFINLALIRHNAAELDQFVSAHTGKTTPLLLAGAAAANGPLRVSSANPRYFVDGTGKVVYLTGSHTWANFQDNGNGNPPAAFEYGKYLDFLTANNHNFFRLWTWEQSRWTLETADDNYWFNPQGPYVRSSGQGNALDGQPKWDVSQFDQAYFDRMRQRIVEAGQRGMYVSIMLFDGWSVVSNQYPALNNPWKGHPHNAANNINGVNGDVNNDNNGREAHTLANPEVTALQEAYVKQVIDTVNDLDNVLYEIANEAADESLPWQYHMVDFIHTYEAGKPKQHPVGITGRYEWSVDDLIASGAEWISPGGSAYQWDPPAADGQAVVIVDTDHLWGIGGDYVWVWKSFTRGLNPIFMDGYDGAGYGVGGEGFNFSDPQWVKLRANLGYARTYAEQANLAAMAPHGDLCSTGYCLANPVGPGAEYIVYQPNGADSFTVDLAGQTGLFAVEWLDPETGAKTTGAAVNGGGTATFTPPFADAVLYLKQQSALAILDSPILTHGRTRLFAATQESHQ